MPAPVIDKGIATSGLLAHVPVAKYADHLPLYRQELIYAWAGAHPRAFLGDWRGELMCDDYGGYKACFEQGMAEVGCMAYARRRFFELHQSGKSQIAEQALKSIGQLYEIETRVASLPPEARQRLRDQQARPIAEALHTWMTAHRLKVPDGVKCKVILSHKARRRAFEI